ncbi:phage protein NinX family protein [Rouxiella sp. T17]|uniref:phage protein NinX family protein n=1 Tax=Rouxiella sp. T17 TaxID=3085684 RepID=UPI002FC9D26C
MIKWSEEPDNELNHNVALLTGEDPDKWYPYGGMKGKDYCNNPSDAWPIICANKINLNFKEMAESKEWLAHISGHEGQWQASCAKPLRAAMICFLLSKTCAE